MALGEDLVEVPTLGGVEGVDGEIVQDQEVDGEQLAELDFIAIIEAGVSQRLEHLIGPAGEDARRPTARDVPEGMREKRLADADGADDGDMGMGLEKA